MRDVGDELPILTVGLEFFLVGQLELYSHLLKVLAELLNFLHTLHLDLEIEVAVADVLGGFGQVLDRAADS